MYHYLKWAAISFFFRRNFRYLVIIIFSILAIYGIDAIYQDFSDYYVVTGRSENIFPLLILKWVLNFFLILLMIVTIIHLGFVKSENPKKKRGRDENKTGGSEIEQTDLIMMRLDKFRTKNRLRRKSDFLMEKRKNMHKNK